MTIRDDFNRTLRREYAQGFGDGIREALYQLIAESEIEGTDPAPQDHVDDELRKWAKDALARLEAKP